MKHKTLLIITAILLPAGAHAWSHKGHATIADIAAANLTTVAHAQIRELLKNDLDANEKPSGRTTLADISSWPDEIRTRASPGTYRGWHSRANPVCSDLLGNCKNGHCIDQIIINQTAILKDHTQSPRTRNEALKWVVHLIGDLHMPLHSGNNYDGGGNIPVRLSSTGSSKARTLHEVWDNELLKYALKRGPIGKIQEARPLTTDAPTAWMQETRILARQHVYEPLPGFACGSKPEVPITLNKDYLEQSAPIIREQVGKAGARLAQLLNETLR